MNEETEKVLKKEMGYTEVEHSCGTCCHYTEIEDPHIDKSWLSICTFNTIGNFIVLKTAFCKYWRIKPCLTYNIKKDT